MQVCNDKCRIDIRRVSYSPQISSMYDDHVYCTLCECYFIKPYPRYCECCRQLVRNKGRSNWQKRDVRVQVSHRKWMVKDILALKASGKL